MAGELKVALDVETMWEGYVKGTVEGEKEAFQAGFLVAVKYMASGHQGIINHLEEEFGFELTEIPQH